MPKKSPTNETTHQILDHLFRLNLFAWRNNVTGIYDRAMGAYRPSAGKKGVSDILFIFPHRLFKERPPIGQFGCIEVKTGRDRLSVEQQGFIQTVIAQGGIALVVKNYEDFTKQFQTYEATVHRG